jgi:hypothetical protein
MARLLVLQSQAPVATVIELAKVGCTATDRKGSTSSILQSLSQTADQLGCRQLPVFYPTAYRVRRCVGEMRSAIDAEPLGVYVAAIQDVPSIAMVEDVYLSSFMLWCAEGRSRVSLSRGVKEVGDSCRSQLNEPSSALQLRYTAIAATVLAHRAALPLGLVSSRASTSRQ